MPGRARRSADRPDCDSLITRVRVDGRRQAHEDPHGPSPRDGAGARPPAPAPLQVARSGASAGWSVWPCSWFSERLRPAPVSCCASPGGLSGRVNRCQRHGASELFLSAHSSGRTLPGGYRGPRCRRCRAEIDARAAVIALSGKRGRSGRERLAAPLQAGVGLHLPAAVTGGNTDARGRRAA